MSLHLFSPLQLKDVTLRNRVAMSPMCQYSAKDGFAGQWHFVHYGSRAVGGAGLVIVEATAVEPRGRISPQDLGLWDDDHVEPLARIAGFVKEHGAAAGIQIAHAGRKAGVARPWEGGRPLPRSGDDGSARGNEGGGKASTATSGGESEGGWHVVGPSAVPFRDDFPAPEALDAKGMDEVVEAFRRATKRSLEAGFDVIELHGAHGYLLHEFLSLLSNMREDEYGGSLENRMRFPLRVAKAVREVWPDRLPMFVRVSATDWVEGGWDVEQTIEFSKRLREMGIDLIDVSSGGNVPNASIPAGPNYQVPFATRIRKEGGIPTGAVGLITEPEQAQAIVQRGEADLILLGRELLRNPYWPLQAREELGAVGDVSLADSGTTSDSGATSAEGPPSPGLWPPQYVRARP